MRKLYLITGILVFVLAACNVGKREQAIQLIKDFEETNVSDKREVNFDITAIYDHGKLILKGETSEPGLKNQLLTKLESLNFRDSIVILPDNSVGEKSFAIVTVPVANLKAGPSYSSELVTQAILGTPVKILKIVNGWYYVQTPDNYISWVDAAGIYPVSNTEFQQWKDSERIIFNKINGSVYEDEYFTIPISDVTLGCILQKTDENYRRFQVQFPDSRTGYVSVQDWTDFNSFKEITEPIPEQIVNLAKLLNGRTYLWGGTSANAMDCSGFVKTIYFFNGLILARDASLQALHGNEVNLSNVQPADLLFFGSQATETEDARVTHVALSLGEAEFIHESGIVKQNSFNPASAIYSEYRKNTFIKAMRVIGFENSGIQPVKNHPWY